MISYLYINRPIFKKISSEAKNLLANMLQTDPRKRLSATECLNHDWITGIGMVLNILMIINTCLSTYIFIY